MLVHVGVLCTGTVAVHMKVCISTFCSHNATYYKPIIPTCMICNTLYVTPCLYSYRITQHIGTHTPTDIYYSSNDLTT